MKYNVGQGLTGAASGALGGFGAGGPWGALAGLLMGGMGGFGSTQKDKLKQLPTMTKEQQGLLNQMTSMLGPQGQLGQGMGESTDWLREMLNPSEESFSKFSQPYMNEFNQQTVPGLAERFAGMGGMGGGLSSSGFGQSLSSAGGNLQSNLAALKASMGQNAASQLMGQYNQGLSQALGAKPFGYQFQQGGPDAFTQGLSGYMQGGMPGVGQMGGGIKSLIENLIMGMSSSAF